MSHERKARIKFYYDILRKCFVITITTNDNGPVYFLTLSINLCLLALSKLRSAIFQKKTVDSVRKPFFASS